MNQASVTIIGRLTGDPKVYQANGTKKAFTKISVAVNEQRGEESVPNFYDISVFGELGENAATTLHKGQQVIVVGRLNSYQEPFTTEDGREVHRNRVGITASAIGPDLFRQFVKVAKMAAPGNGHKPFQGAGAPETAPETAPQAAAASVTTSVNEEDF